MIQLKESGWIWIIDWSAEDKDNTRIVYFRKGIDLEETITEARINVSADSRYRLFVNGTSIGFGPCKGDNQIWYYETYDVAPYLVKGQNVISAVVLHYPLSDEGNNSVWRTKTPGFYMKGVMKSGTRSIDIDADNSWKSKRIDSLHVLPEAPDMRYLYHTEEVFADGALQGWTKPGFDDSGWAESKVYSSFEISKAVSPGNLYKRPVPLMYEEERYFDKVVVSRKGNTDAKVWDGLLRRRNTVSIPASSTEIVEISAGELTTGFLQLSVYSGAGARIRILSSEAYAYRPEETDDFMFKPLKGDRADWKNGELFGFTDVYHVGGYGTAEENEYYEPFWFRTFRYIRLEITTAKQPLVITDFSYRETGYPLKAETKVQVSDASMDDIWDISMRTLRRCMHETYEDCPFYEQLQYAMDTRSQILYTYAVSGDDRMARRCIDDYHRSLRYDGLINCCYPSYGPNVIPTFSLYYILIIYDHMMYFGDKELVRKYMPTVLSILNFFDRAITEQGLVGRTGGPLIDSQGNWSAYWSFIDWTDQWEATFGVPDAMLEGPVTVESLMYAYVLQHSARMAEYIGRKELAQEFADRAECIKKAVNMNCKGNNGLYQDGPGVEKYSQHCQVWAVLSETVPDQQVHGLMKETLENNELTQCSVAMAFYLFRAVEKAGLYEYTEKLWEPWHQMLRDNLTTCVEDQVGKRSDCHAWGALILYELPSVILGVRPITPGSQVIQVKPAPGYMTWAKGKVMTPQGMVEVSWEKLEDGTYQCGVTAPEGVQVEIIKPE